MAIGRPKIDKSVDNTVPNPETQISENQINEQYKKPNFVDEDEWLTTQEAASYLKTTEGVLRNDVSGGKIPYYKFGRRNRYLKSELRQLLLDQKRGSNGNEV